MFVNELEAKLLGGCITTGVVKVGHTVRRPCAPNAEYVRSILLHLEAVGFDGAPRYLGVDQIGRETFSYIPGEVPIDLGHFDDETLEAAARLICRFHDATALLDSATSDEVACHNDLSPCNTVFQDGHPVAFIDFDAAAPGLRSHDLGYAAWLWLDIGDAERSAVEQQRRLKLFLAAYGPKPSEAEVIAAMLVRQSIIIAEDKHASSWAAKCRDWTLTHLSLRDQPQT
jgi:hypothetical protein